MDPSSPVASMHGLVNGSAESEASVELDQQARLGVVIELAGYAVARAASATVAGAEQALRESLDYIGVDLTAARPGSLSMAGGGWCTMPERPNVCL